MSWEQLAVAQELAAGRDLVTYWTASWPSYNSRGGPFATGAPAPHGRSLGIDPGSPACSASGAELRPYWRDDILVWSKTADATDCENSDRITVCNASTGVDTTWPPAMLNSRQTGNQLGAGEPAYGRNKTERNKRRKLFSGSFEQDGFRTRRRELYAVRFGTKVQRHSQPGRTGGLCHPRSSL